MKHNHIGYHFIIGLAWGLMLALGLNSKVYCAELIDLGSLEISGDVRRPMMSVIDSSIVQKKLIVDLLRRTILEKQNALTVSFFSNTVGGSALQRETSLLSSVGKIEEKIEDVSVLKFK